MKIIKRSGKEVDFAKIKIVHAIQKANAEMENEYLRLTEAQIEAIADMVEKKCLDLHRAPSVEEVQDMVEDGIIQMRCYEVAKLYIKYRYKRSLNRKANTTDESILSIIDLSNEEIKQENSNKNPTVASVQRDYMAGEVSKDITERILLPEDVVKAHKEGIIHFHDADYFAQRIHNCLDVNTKFITDKGVKTFRDFNDGDSVVVLTKDGNWKKAVVKCYGKDKLFKYVFYNGKKEFTHEVLATENHRWYLNDGSITTSLKVGDKLAKAPVIYNQDEDYETFNDSEKLMWCKGFALGDGTVEFNGAGNHYNSTRIRLCGEKDTQWLQRFNIEGCTVRNEVFENCDRTVVVKNYHKEIPEFSTTREILAFFNGLYCADGKMAINNPHSRTYRIQSSDEKVISFIREYAPVAGLYITRENDLTGEKTNFTDENGRKYTILFSFNPNFNFSYTVLSKTFEKVDETWCLEVEDEHNFVLANGMVTGNCDLINLEDMLQNGTVISGTLIERPHSFYTACNITTQIVAQVASSQYGGQSFSLAHLIPFVEVSRQKIRKQVIEERTECGDSLDTEVIERVVAKRLKEEITRGIQTIQYQLITLQTTNGQAPFVTMFIYLDEVPEGQMRDDLAMVASEVFKQRYEGVKNDKGVFITPAFPKLIYVLDEDNVYEGSKYFWLTEEAARTSAKRLVPDYISAKKMMEYKGAVYTCMGCRSFLTVEDSQRNPDGSYKFYGRFNQGVVTINLVDVACSSGKDMDKFWDILEERLELCHRALRCRHERLKGTISDVAPLLWQHGALARLQPGETIDKLLFGGYSTISLGYAGLYEMCYYMTGKSHTDPEATPFAMAVMQKLNDKCKEWRNAENIAYSVYGTPLESTTYKFAKCLQRRFGKIENVTDHNYITNSYHVNVREQIDAFEKLRFEAPFQRLSPGGNISYIETADLTTNTEAVIKVLQFIYETTMYAELNTKSDYCHCCGYDKQISVLEDENGKLYWKCPNCGNTDQTKMNVARRTCGYIGSNFWNQGRTQEIKDRYVHL